MRWPQTILIATVAVLVAGYCQAGWWEVQRADKAG